MLVETRFNVGDKLYTLETEHVDKQCTVCEGEKIVIYKGEAYPCHKCSSTGTIQSREFKYKIKKTHTVISAKVSIGGSHCNVKYKTKCEGFRGGFIKEEMLFKTVEEATIKCSEMNEELENNNQVSATY